jgi:octaprenyl-diphosphate synthase
MSAIQKIKAPIELEMEQFQPYFRNFLKSKATLLNLILMYILKQKGKQMRPMLVFLFGQIAWPGNRTGFSRRCLN